MAHEARVTVKAPPKESSYRGTMFLPQITNLVNALETIDPLMAGCGPHNWLASQLQNWNEMVLSANGSTPLLGSEMNLLTRLATLHLNQDAKLRTAVDKSKLLIIDGPTGVGKTTLVEGLGLPVITEAVDDNTWLASSADPTVAPSVAFQAQLHFMLGRFADLHNIYQGGNEGSFVADRFLRGDAAYIAAHHQQGNISDTELRLLNRTRELLSPLVPDSKTILLYCGPTELARRVLERGREFEVANMDEVLASQDRTIQQMGLSAPHIHEAFATRIPRLDLVSSNGDRVVAIDTTKMSAVEVREEVGLLVN